jgi:TAG lipase/steryl ester hydrolase/phospholipase A2/LPA acyltransferase
MMQLLLPSLRISQLPSNDTPSRNLTSKKGATPAPNTAIEPLSRVIKGAGSLVLYLKDGLTESERESRRLLEEQKEILSARLQNAETFKEWDKAAHELDALEGNDEWKKDVMSGDYNPELIKDRLRALDEARTNCDMRAMVHLIRTALSRDLGGMGNIDLYRHSRCGTKKLIDRYVESTLQTITALVDQSSHSLPEDLESKDLLEAVLFARQSFGRSALLLSGGGTFGMTHIGVLKAMFEVKLLPRIISGASAGSIVCAVVCSRTDDEIPQLIEEFPYGDLAVFEEEGNEDSLVGHLRRLLTQGNWSDIKHLTRVMRNLLGDITFLEAYNRTRRICNICVSSASIYELPRLLNYVTAPNVMIWSAVAASCSVPLVFSAAPLLVKNPLTGEHSPWNPTPQMWIDGSVDNDLPMTRLAEMFNVNHFIVSQVNPHVVPFLAKDETMPSGPGSPNPPAKDESDWMHTITQLAKGEALHRMQVLAEIGIFPNLVTKLRSILNQKYSGDINIIPALGVMDLPKILKNPSRDFMFRSCLIGERATWPKISRIRDCCAIELALDRAVHALRARVVFSKSQVDLRRMATGGMTNTMRGSHEPLNAMSPGGVSSREHHKSRPRRSSGSNLHTSPAHRQPTNSPYKIVDDDTDEEKHLEMSYRKPHGKPKMKLNRLPNRPLLHTGPKTTPNLSSSNEPNAFDFAKTLPATKLSADQSRLFMQAQTMSPIAGTINIDESSNVKATDGTSEIPRAQEITSFSEMESSEMPSSDEDIDSRSDNSIADIPTGPSDLDLPPIKDEWLHRMDVPDQPTTPNEDVL